MSRTMTMGGTKYARVLVSSLSQSSLTPLSHFLSHGTLCMVQFDLILSPRATPGTIPALWTRGWGMGNCQKRSCPGVRGWGKSKLTALDFAKNESFLARFTLCLRTSRLTIFKGKHRNLSESHGWRGITHQNLRACLHGVGYPGLVGLVSFAFTLWGTQNKTPCKQGLSLYLRVCLKCSCEYERDIFIDLYCSTLYQSREINFHLRIT